MIRNTQYKIKAHVVPTVPTVFSVPLSATLKAVLD